MSQFNKPVGPHDPFDKFRVNPIEKDRSAQEKSFESEAKGQAPKALLLLIHLLQLFKRLITLVYDVASGEKISPLAKFIKADLGELKEALLLLGGEDHSHDPNYLRHLADLWQRFLAQTRYWNPASPISKKMLEFKEMVDLYPAASEHSFGFYLSQHAGEDQWIPFPYMELVQALHAEHQRDPLNSTLRKWVQILETILSYKEIRPME